MIALKAKDDLAIFDDLLRDRGFRAEYERLLVEALTPVLLEPFLAGFVAGAKLKPKTVEKAMPSAADVPDWIDPQDLARLAETAITDYVPEFTKNIAETTYNQVRDAVAKSRQTGSGVEGVLRDIQGLFSRSRAETIAITETTRLFGLGAQASYKAQGFNAWVWMSVNDPWVDPVCAGLSADSEAKPFPMDQLFSPAHPRCRCFPSPVVVDVPKDEAGRVPTEAELAEIAKIEDVWLAVNDPKLEAMAKIRGFDGLPKIGSVDKVVADGGIEVLRGVSKVEFADAFKTGPYFGGQGIHGNGTYAAGLSKADTASSHSNSGDGAVFRIGIPKSARIATEKDIQAAERTYPDQFSDPDVKKMIGMDPGKVALMLGYDAIHIERRDFWVILNRSILTVEE